jgi:hypothetical protein
MAVVRSAAASEPESGSLIATAMRSALVMTLSRIDCRWASVPHLNTVRAGISTPMKHMAMSKAQVQEGRLHATCRPTRCRMQGRRHRSNVLQAAIGRNACAW